MTAEQIKKALEHVGHPFHLEDATCSRFEILGVDRIGLRTLLYVREEGKTGRKPEDGCFMLFRGAESHPLSSTRRRPGSGEL